MSEHGTEHCEGDVVVGALKLLMGHSGCGGEVGDHLGEDCMIRVREGFEIYF